MKASCSLLACVLLTTLSAIRGEERAAPALAPPSTALSEAPGGFDATREGRTRGKVDEVEYESKSVGIRRKMMVYPPPGLSTDSKYPVLYLLHGIGDTQKVW